MITNEQAKKIISDVRASNKNIVAGFAVLPRDQYASSNELYEEIHTYFNRSLDELRKLNIVSQNNGGFGQDFNSYGFPYVIPNMEQLDCIFCYIEIMANQFRWKCIFRYTTNDEMEYQTTLRISYIPGNNRNNNS